MANDVFKSVLDTKPEWVEFLNKGLFDIDEPESNTYDSKLTALYLGLQRYYETCCIWDRKDFFRYLDRGNGREDLTLRDCIIQTKGHNYQLKYFASITFIHLSFEHFIIEILESKSIILSKYYHNKKNVIDLIINNEEFPDLSEKDNIRYHPAIKRLEELIHRNNELPTNLRIEQKYHFLKNHIHTLDQLRELRNDLIHSGSNILDRFTYEYFFVNKLLPLIREYLRTQESSLHIERNLHNKKNVIDEIIKIPLEEEYKNLNTFEEVTRNLRRINHFKELGRASFRNPIEMFEKISSFNQNRIIEYKASVEMYSNKTIRDKAKQKVEFHQVIMDKLPVHICPCCGTETLIKTENDVAECLTCTYKIYSFLGEPQEFEIMDTVLFE